MSQQRRPRASVSIAASCVLAVLGPAAVRGATTYALSGIGQYQYTSNVFDLQPKVPVPGTEDFHRSDSFYLYEGEFELDHTWRLQDWHFLANAAALRYDYFSQLSHNEYKLDGSWKWRLGPRVDGMFEVLRQRVMVPFTELSQLQLQLATSTEQRETAGIGYQVLQHWKIEASAYTRSVLEPLTDAPDLRLLESQVGATLKYLGTAGLTWGFNATYLHGDYSHTNGIFNPAYDQKSAALVATYLPQSGSTLNAAIGYSRRDSAASIDSTSGVTGHLALTRQLTGKTSIELTLDRNVSSYLTTAGSEIDTSARVGVSWHATYKIAVSALYVWTYSDFPSQGVVPGSDRIDHMQYTSLTINYRPREWLVLKPYANLQTRTSNYPADHFNTNIFGVQLVTRWQQN